MRDTKSVVRGWFLGAGLITLALIPIRAYVTSGNDPLFWPLLAIGISFLAVFGLLLLRGKPMSVKVPLSR